MVFQTNITSLFVLESFSYAELILQTIPAPEKLLREQLLLRRTGQVEHDDEDGQGIEDEYSDHDTIEPTKTYDNTNRLVGRNKKTSDAISHQL
jgi:hypothetical protein